MRVLTAGVRMNMYLKHISFCLSRTGQKSSWKVLVNNLMVSLQCKTARASHENTENLLYRFNETYVRLR